MPKLRMFSLLPLVILLATTNPLLAIGSNAFSSIAIPSRETQAPTRILSGYILTQQNERLPGVSVIVRSVAGETPRPAIAKDNFASKFLWAL